jgi:endonuclease/exonuclease/phosphatase family metal-dependent hydrolase
MRHALRPGVKAVVALSALCLASIPISLTPASATSVSVPPYPTSVIVRVMNWNMCGADPKCGNDGATTNYGTFKTLLTNYKPQLLTLQEVCSTSDTSWLQTNWRAIWPNGTWSYLAKRTTSQCGTSTSSIGTMILSSQALGTAATKRMPIKTSSGAADDTILCASTTITVPIELCTTHLDNDGGGSVDDAQLNGADAAYYPTLLTDGATSWLGAAPWVENQANGHPLVFGGDFNSKVGDPALFYVYKGIIKNGDPGQTTGQKLVAMDYDIDHIFFDAAHTGSRSLTTKALSSSDHPVGYGTVTLCTTQGGC